MRDGIFYVCKSIIAHDTVLYQSALVGRCHGGPQAYMCTALDGFPNFFMVGGPNSVTGHWSIILVTENMVGYITKIIRPVLKGNARFVEPKKQAVLEWADKIQRDLKGTVFVDSKSWYQDKDGFNSMMYP